jgi:hypothetical protein
MIYLFIFSCEIQSNTKDDKRLVMDTIIAKNIFQTTGGDLKVNDSTQIVSRDAQALEVK